jgi:hypothetical protein
MSGREISWRISMLLQGIVDRIRIPLGAYPATSGHVPGDSLEDLTRGFTLARDFSADDYPSAWRDHLLAAADQIADHKLSFFNLERQFLGNPINWHRDHNSDVDTQKGQIQTIDYRDFRYNGDCKHVWEPNRHHQFVVLARAYRASGDKRYALALADQLASWIEQNPFGYGMNWRSPLELGVRLINWVWALELVRPSGCISGELWRKIYQNAYLLCWDIQRKYSRGSSANNHLVGEAAGVFVASCYFASFPQAAAWRDEARRILMKEIAAQSYDDGCTREQALGYQFFVIQFYLFSGLVGNWTDNRFPQEYWERLRSMIDFVARIAEAGPLPLFGDQDDGYVLDLGDHARDVSALLDVAAQVPELGDEAACAKQSETAFWLFGSRPDRDSSPGPSSSFPSVAFPESGYYLLQNNDQGRQISVMMDCAELGYGSIAAHGHADSLAVTVRAYGHYVLVDTGTFDYFTQPAWRNYFRTTAAHNTVVVDGADQSEMLGPFLWGARANSECLEWEDSRDYTRVAGQHDGYHALADPVTHQRTVTLMHEEQECIIEDKVTHAGQHSIEVYFHLGPDCKLESIDANVCIIRVGGENLFILSLDESLKVRTLHGSEDPIGGWYSAGYHQKTPITTIIGSRRLTETSTLEHKLAFSG